LQGSSLGVDSVSATLDALVAENRELRRELASHRERLRAIERSRWWRLHPRRVMGQSLLNGVAASPPPVGLSADAMTGVLGSSRLLEDASLARFRAEVVARGSFSKDWLTSRFSLWRSVLVELDDRPARILEIGSFEGLSTCFFLWRLPGARVTCVDTFAGGVEDAGMTRKDLEDAFDANVTLVDASRVRKLVGDSKRRLLDLSDGGEEFELVYVDGSHLALDVLVDAAHAWGLLAPNGTIVFDDYRWRELGDDVLLRPGKAIDVFRELVEGKYELVYADDQVALRRIT
jgi:hypothetical protein